MGTPPQLNQPNFNLPGPYRGSILAFNGWWQYGIAQLVIGRPKNGRDTIQRAIPCENGPTARALISAFALCWSWTLHRQSQASRLQNRVLARRVWNVGRLYPIAPSGFQAGGLSNDR